MERVIAKQVVNSVDELVDFLSILESPTEVFVVGSNKIELVEETLSDGSIVYNIRFAKPGTGR